MDLRAFIKRCPHYFYHFTEKSERTDFLYLDEEFVRAPSIEIRSTLFKYLFVPILDSVTSKDKSHRYLSTFLSSLIKSNEQL
jgi:hypothetical protein